MTKEQLTKERILTKITISEVGQNINPLYKEKLLKKMENKYIEFRNFCNNNIYGICPKCSF